MSRRTLPGMSGVSPHQVVSPLRLIGLCTNLIDNKE